MLHSTTFHARLTFGPNDGHVDTVIIDDAGDLSEAEKTCATGILRGAKVPPFLGSSVSVGKSYTVMP